VRYAYLARALARERSLNDTSPKRGTRVGISAARASDAECVSGSGILLVGRQASSKIDLHRGNRIPRPRDKPPKIAFRPETVCAETETQPQEPANCGLFGRLREISRFERVRGGPGRIRTSNQTIINRRL
jgi:hypothetical protein